uniref:NADH-ubiquinone oxidoreductase chain 2 n=1 Tax=Urolabida sp. FS-2019 TaxID=2575687 RepID=A0A4D6X1B8_9HEMI|nr:NADH dehydrogenase subunit 2 [Urolabida sp. FS-2019]
MMKTKILMMVTMITGTVITMSSENWLSMWMGMEMNLMSFIPLINLKPHKASYEASMVYFLVQSISSIILLSMVILIMIKMNNMMTKSTLIMSILIKMGAAPFHMWLPKVMSVMSWNNNIIFMTWQKIAPMYLLNMMEYMKIMNFSIVMTVVIGALGGLNQTSLRKIMAYSSINHLGWMMILSKTKDNWIIYIMLYSLLMITVCAYFKSFNLLYTNQLFNMNMNNLQKMNLIIIMMSLGGMPPMLGFLPKWMVIEEMMMDKSMFIITVMIMFSMLTLFFYMRISLKVIMLQSLNNKWSFNKNKYNLNMFMINLVLPVIIMLY